MNHFALLFTFLCLFSCGQRIVLNEELETTAEESILAVLANQDTLRITENEGIILLERSGDAPCIFQFNHPQFSEVVFPQLSVAIIDKNGGYLTKQYHIDEHGALFLPLIGIHHKLHVYFLDSHNCSMIDGLTELRTTLPFLWINPANNTFLTASRGGFTAKDKWPYHFLVFKMDGSISKLEQHVFETDSSLEDNMQMQARIVADILLREK